MKPTCADDSATARASGTCRTVAPSSPLGRVPRSLPFGLKTNRFTRVSLPTMERISAICSPQELPILRFLLYCRGGSGAQSTAIFSGVFSWEQLIRSMTVVAKRAVLAPRTGPKNVRKVLIFNIL